MGTSSIANHIAENVERVRQTISEAAMASGRDADAIRLVAVTKYVGIDVVEALISSGCVDLGESRPQALWSKCEELRELDGLPTVRWHQIGHLQRNKVHRTLPLVSMIHSIDSPRLLKAVGEAARECDRIVDVLLQVNISGEAAKHGFSPDELAEAIESVGRLPSLHLRGLMGMASLEGGREQARRDFASLRQLRDEIVQSGDGQLDLAELSMGMSRDYDLAILEGATIVRVGSTLFEGIET